MVIVRRNFCAPSRRARKHFSHQVEALEPRLMMDGDPVQIGDLSPYEESAPEDPKLNPAETIGVSTPQITYSTLANGMPILNSYSAAPASIFLDFDGGTFHGTTAQSPYDTDGDNTTFSLAEQGVIVEAWRQMSMYYSAFNVNVTTIQPTSGIPTAWVIISPDVSGGSSYINVFPNSRAESHVDQTNAQSRESGIAHEIGHNFGNQHTSNYNSVGTKTAEYHSAFDPLHGPIMGIDYSGIIHKFTLWHSTTGVLNTEDDVGNISSSISKRVGGDGFRPDDYGNTIATASALTVNGLQQSKTGIIERLTDSDAFSFTSTGGWYDVEVGRDAPSGVDVKISVYDSSGNLLASEDGDPRAADLTMVNDAQLDVNLGAGTYYVIVQSHGNYDDIGQYVVRVDPMAAGWHATDMDLNNLPGYSGYDASTGTFTIAGSGHDIWGTHDGIQYSYQTLTGNGSITAKVTNVTGPSTWAQAGVMIRDSLEDNSKELSMSDTYGHGTIFAYRTSTGGSTSSFDGGVTTSFAPYWVRLVRTGNSFTAYRSTDGVNFTQWGSTQIVSMGSTVYIGLSSSAVDDGSSSSTPRALDVATMTNVTVTGNINVGPTLNTLPTPNAPTLGSVTSNSITLTLPPAGPPTGDTNGDGVVDMTDYTNLLNNFGNSGVGDFNNDGIVDLWDFKLLQKNIGTIGNSGFTIERSSDGVIFNQIATAAPGATTFTDNGLADAQRYYYRVRAIDSNGVSQASSISSAVTRAGAISNLNAITYSPTQIVLDWSDASGETSYRVERSSNNGATWSTLTTLSKNWDLYVDSSAVAGTAYLYHVVTLDGLGVSTTSAPLAVTSPLADVGGLAFTSRTSSQVAFSWASVIGATGYLIQRTDGAGNVTTLASNNATTSFTDTHVTPLGDYYYDVTALNSTTQSLDASEIFCAVPATTSMPSGWTAQDIGTVGGPGADGYSAGTFTAVGSGNNIWSTADEFNFISTPLTGDGWIQARIVSIDQDVSDSIGAVMMRASTAAGAANAEVYIGAAIPVDFTYRTTTGGSSADAANTQTVATPYYARIERAGNVFTGKISPDGTNWTTLGSITISMPSTILIGLATCDVDDSQMVHIVYDHVSTSAGGLVGAGSGSGSDVGSDSGTAVSESLPALLPVVSSSIAPPAAVAAQDSTDSKSSQPLTVTALSSSVLTALPAAPSSQQDSIKASAESRLAALNYVLAQANSHSSAPLITDDVLDSLVGPRDSDAARLGLRLRWR